MSFQDSSIHGIKRQRLDDEHDAYAPSEAEILRLVADRESFRQQRRFAESDEIRDELRSLGVELFDKEKEWRAKDGRRGFLFTAGAAECSLSDSQIYSRIAHREEARKNKDWSLADTLRDELRKSGVELNDKEKTWATGNGRTGSYSFPQSAVQLTVETIRQLVAQRERLRAAQDYAGADELRAQLSQNGVELNDNERVWRTWDGQQGVIVTGGADVDCPFRDAEILDKVAQREEARTRKDWQMADAIRTQLRRGGVELLDQHKVWCTTDGRSGPYSAALRSAGLHAQPVATTAQTPVGAHPALSAAEPKVVRPQGPPLHPVGPMQYDVAAGAASASSDVMLSNASIQSLVAGREHYREKHDWASADAVRADLRAHNVEVWDKDKVWHAADGRSGRICSLHHLDREP